MKLFQCPWIFLTNPTHCFPVTLNFWLEQTVFFSRSKYHQNLQNGPQLSGRHSISIFAIEFIIVAISSTFVVPIALFPFSFFQYNGDPSVTDHEGRNAFYYAHCSQKYDCAEFLLRNGCPKQLVPPSTTGLPVGSSAPTARSSHPSPVLPQQPSSLSSHQLGSCVQPQNSATMEIIGSSVLPDPFVQHSSANPGVGVSVSQPHHFSHLQQQQQQQSCALLSLPSPLISGAQNQTNSGLLVPQVPTQQSQTFTSSKYRGA